MKTSFFVKYLMLTGALCCLFAADTVRAADVTTLGSGRGYNNGNLFQLVMTGNSMDTIRTALIADGHIFVPNETFAANTIMSHQVLFLGLFDPAQTLNSTEQAAILAYVRNGGALIYLGDNDHFAASNSSLAGLFGVTFKTDPSALIASHVLVPNHPILMGPAGVVDSYDGSGNRPGFLGGIDQLGPYAQALLATDSRTLVAVIERNTLQPGSGPVVFIADGNGFMDTGIGGVTFADNITLMRNIFAYVSPGNGECFSDLGCDDALFCTGHETCVDGECAPGVFPCAGGDGCHENTDTCGPCTNDAQCNDGLYCNGLETCVAGLCIAGSFPCSSGQGCDERDDTCGPCGNDGECNDGLFCTGMETCVDGLCLPGGFPCTEGEGCRENGDTCGPCSSNTECDDGLFCNGSEECIAGVCRPGTFPCTDGNGCHEGQDLCGPCNDEFLCDDDVFCNGMENCVGGTCVGGSSPCEAGEVCNEGDDSCGPCVNDKQCDDGLFCNGSESCNTVTGQCTPGTAPCTGLICQEDEDLCAKVSFAVVTVATPTAAENLNELPRSHADFSNGETLYAEIWAQTSHVQGLGCMYADVHYGDASCSLDALSISRSATFNSGPGGTIVAPSLVDEMGGCAQTGGLGLAPVWQLVSRVEIVGGHDCETEICLSAASTMSTNFAGVVIPADQIGYECRTVNFSDCLYDLDGDGFVGPGDLALFASCWLCCDGDECWAENECGSSDFDCDICVGPGDLSFFATAWLKDCATANSSLPPCQSTHGVALPPANAAMMRTFNLSPPPRNWPMSRSDWYAKLRAKAAERKSKAESPR